MTTYAATGETAIPLMPCRSPGAQLDFYETLGFETTFAQTEPYLYASVRRGAVELHFSDFRGFSRKPGFAACLVMVPEIAPCHRAFSDALRARHGRVPTAGLPRISRLRDGLDRFGLFDPSGNWLVFLQPPGGDDGVWQPSDEGGEPPSALQTARDMAALFRDYKGNDDATAAKILDVALARHVDAAPLDRALALADRAELAAALGDAERLRSVRSEIARLPLSAAERNDHHHTLRAADDLEHWIAHGSGDSSARRFP